MPRADREDGRALRTDRRAREQRGRHVARHDRVDEDGLFDAIISQNLRAPFILMQEAVTHMKPRRAGSIVNIGSVNAYIGEPKLCAYSVSKGGLMTLTKNTARHS